MARSKYVTDVAEALISMAADEKVISHVMQDLESLSAVFKAEPALLINLSETAVDLKTRQTALTSALEKNTHTFVLNALLLLQSHDNLEHFRAFADAASKAAKANGHHDVTVISAVELTDKERDDINASLAKKLDGTVRLNETVDPTILGGLIVRTADWELDRSIKGNLQRLNHALYV